MPRYKLLLEYHGGSFVGWQRQDSGPSVQAALEDAVAKFTGESVTIHGAGRTDAGVHALGQVAHFDLSKTWPPATIRNAINFHVKPHPIAVLAAEAAEDRFHARISAKGRAYLYRILNRRAPAAVDRGRVWHVTKPLDVSAMHEAAQVLVGRHDFTTFRASLCQAKSPIKTLDLLIVERLGDEIRVSARARSFLHHQVRNIVGTLGLVGQRKWNSDDVAAALAARDRTRGGPTAPPDGLYLTEVWF